MGTRLGSKQGRGKASQDPALLRCLLRAKAAYDRMRARGVEFTQEPVDRYGTVDAGFRDPSGNGWKMIQTRGVPA